MGWMSVTARVEIMQPLFLWRTLTFPSYTSGVKRLCIKRIAQVDQNQKDQSLFSPMVMRLKTGRKYKLMHYITNAVSTGDYLTLTEWKRIICAVIKGCGIEHYRISQALYRSLGLYRECGINGMM